MLQLGGCRRNEPDNDPAEGVLFILFIYRHENGIYVYNGKG